MRVYALCLLYVCLINIFQEGSTGKCSKEFQSDLSINVHCRNGITDCAQQPLEDTFPTLYNLSGWGHDAPAEVRVERFCANNQAGIHLEWKPPQHRGAAAIQGFGIHLGGHSSEYKCFIILLQKNVAQSDISSSFDGTIYPLPEGKPYVLVIYSLPRTAGSKNITKVISTPKCENIPTSGSWSPRHLNISYSGWQRSLTVTFDPPPVRFGITHFKTSLFSKTTRKFVQSDPFSKTEYTFFNILPGVYDIRMEPLEPHPYQQGRCVCRDGQDRCSGCLQIKRTFEAVKEVEVARKGVARETNPDKTGTYIAVTASLAMCIGIVALLVTVRKKCQGQASLCSHKQITPETIGCPDDHVVIVTTSPDVPTLSAFVRTFTSDFQGLTKVHVLRAHDDMEIAKLELINFCRQLTAASGHSTMCNLRCAQEMMPHKVVLCYVLYSYPQINDTQVLANRVVNDLNRVLKNVDLYNVMAITNADELLEDACLNQNCAVYKVMDEYTELTQFIRTSLGLNSVNYKPTAEKSLECSELRKISVPNAPLCRLSTFSYDDQNLSSLENLVDLPLLSSFEKKGYLGVPFARRERYVSCDSGHVTSENSYQSSSLDEGQDTASRTSASLGENVQPDPGLIRPNITMVFDKHYNESHFDSELTYNSRCPSGIFLPPEPSELSFSDMDDQVLESFSGRFNDSELINFSEKLDTISFISCEGHQGNALKKHVTKYWPKRKEVSRRKSLSMESIMNMMAEINKRNDEAFTS